MKNILLHVGTHKTGSTSIQQTFHNNREHLRKHDIHFLDFGPNHWHVYSAFMDDPWDWFEHRRMQRKKKEVDDMNSATLISLKEEILNSAANNIIISSEYLSQLSFCGITRMRDYLRDLGDVKVFYYCRNIISWLSSDSQQCAKVGMKTKPTCYNVAIQRLIDFPKNYIKVFGPAQFYLIRFEDAVEDGLCDTLLKIGGLPSLQDMGICAVKVNESISSNATKAFFILNKVSPIFKNERSSHIVNVLKKMPGEKNIKITLTADEIDDHNNKCDNMKSQYGFQMYDDISYSSEKDEDYKLDENSAGYLLKAFNELALTHEAQSKITSINVDSIRDAALEFEQSNPKLACQLMEIAHKLRPKGQFIERKLEAYRNNIIAD